MMQHCLSQRAAFPPTEGYTHSPKGVIPGTMCSTSFATLSILIDDKTTLPKISTFYLFPLQGLM